MDENREARLVGTLGVSCMYALASKTTKAAKASFLPFAKYEVPYLGVVMKKMATTS